ncbi:hypothetical protein RhiJN_07124 [Ceratobasidium sp. AG-Ba]|nr:hypothetical protein RhiJN_07124 [Ceratobasidium sp. AG-Ba]
MIVVPTPILLVYELYIQSRSEDTISDDISVLLQLELPSIVSPERAKTLCYDHLSGRVVNSTIYDSRSGSFVSSDSKMSLVSLCGGLSFADGCSTTGENVLSLPDIADYQFTFTLVNVQVSHLSLNKELGKGLGVVISNGGAEVEMRPARRLRLEDTFAMPGEDISVHQLTSEKSAVGVPPLDVLKFSLSTVRACSSDLPPDHTHAVSVAHEESAVLVPSEIESSPSRTSEPPDNPLVVLSGQTTSASTLVLSQARGRLLLLLCE